MAPTWRRCGATLAVVAWLSASVSACAQQLQPSARSDAASMVQPAVAAPAQPLPQVQAPSIGASNSTPPSTGASTPPANTGGSTPEEAAQSTGGNVAELQQLVRGNELTELRTAYNGSYGASMLYRAREMTYYVALFQQKNFWRVIKTQNTVRAEAIYNDFVGQTVQLSTVEIKRIQLEAQKAFTQRMIAVSQARADELQADVNVAQVQQQQVSDRQKQILQEATALDAERAEAQAQLKTLQDQIRRLQRQADAGLPASGQRR